jgi:hypothetical protein
MSVPPSAVAANRAQLMTLQATNLLGQNTAAIAANEVEYGQSGPRTSRRCTATRVPRSRHPR